MPARRTPEPGEARRQASTRQKIFEGPLHEPREAVPVTPEEAVLDTIVRDHYETFRAQAAGCCQD